MLEELRARGWTLGGEQSGHIIDMGFNRTGDGIASALLTLEALGGRDLSERDAMQKLPQRLVNVRVRDRDALDGARELGEAVRSAESQLAGRGRVLVRPSGTEPLVRVMVEAPTDDEAEEVCGRLVGARRARARLAAPAKGSRGAGIVAAMCGIVGYVGARAGAGPAARRASASSSTAAMTPPGSRSSRRTGSRRCARSAT